MVIILPNIPQTMGSVAVKYGGSAWNGRVSFGSPPGEAQHGSTHPFRKMTPMHSGYSLKKMVSTAAFNACTSTGQGTCGGEQAPGFTGSMVKNSTRSGNKDPGS